MLDRALSFRRGQQQATYANVENLHVDGDVVTVVDGA